MSPSAGRGSTHNNTGKTALGVAVALKLFRHRNENTGGQSHVEDTVRLLSLATFLNLFKVLVEVDEGVVLVILTGDVGAECAELI